LHPITGSLRSLGLGNGNPPAVLQSPFQVGFTPDGSQLVIAMKGNHGGSVDVFSISPDGRLSDAPTATAVGGNAFALMFRSGRPVGQRQGSIRQPAELHPQQRRQPLAGEQGCLERSDHRVLGDGGQWQ
jgi:hypothetical protein